VTFVLDSVVYWRSLPGMEAWIRLGRLGLTEGRALQIRPLAHWIKSKNPNAPAVRREAEEDWGR
jgi:hypothetical protein